MTVELVIALACALVSTALVNVAYLREQAAARALPPLSRRHPLASLRLLLGSRRWLGGLALERPASRCSSSPLALAPLALVQSPGRRRCRPARGSLSARIAHRSLLAARAARRSRSRDSLMLGVSLAGERRAAAGGRHGRRSSCGSARVRRSAPVVRPPPGGMPPPPPPTASPAGSRSRSATSSTKVATQGGARPSAATLIARVRDRQRAAAARLPAWRRAHGRRRRDAPAPTRSRSSRARCCSESRSPRAGWACCAPLAFVAVVAGAILRSHAPRPHLTTRHGMLRTPGPQPRTWGDGEDDVTGRPTGRRRRGRVHGES